MHSGQEFDIGNCFGAVDRQLALLVEKAGSKTPHHRELILHQVLLTTGADAKSIALGGATQLIGQGAHLLPRRRRPALPHLLHPVSPHIESSIGSHQRHSIGLAFVLAGAESNIYPLLALGGTHISIQRLQHPSLGIFGNHPHEEKTQIGQVVALDHGIVEGRPLIVGDKLLFNFHPGMFRLEPFFPYSIGLELGAHPDNSQSRAPILGHRAATPAPDHGEQQT